MKQQNMTHRCIFSQQRNSAVFTTAADESYDAYDRDISIVSFYFEEATIHEFSR